MPCVCAQCIRNGNTLGLEPRQLSQAVLRKAFRRAAKQWHPDRFENEPVKRLEAEEHFKLLQVAYRELWEHLENPERTAPPEAQPETQPVTEEPAPPPVPPKPEEPPPFFGGAAGCYTTPHFPRPVFEIIAGHLQDNERALAFVDLSYQRGNPQEPTEYLLFTSYRVFVRDAFNQVSLLWYTDLGEIRLIDLHRDGRPSLRQRIVEGLTGIQRRYSLEILRHTGGPFCTITKQVDDSVKKVIYNFLRQKKNQANP